MMGAGDVQRDCTGAVEAATKEEESKRNSDIKNEFIVRVIKETVNSITLQWNFITLADVYRIEQHHRTGGWRKVQWTSQCSTIVEDLEASFGYLLRVKALQLAKERTHYETLQVSNEIVGSTMASEPTAICLFRAIKKGQQFLVKRILRRRPTLIEYPGPNGYTPLASAIALGDMCVVDILLSAGASVHEGNAKIQRTPLHQAFYYGRLPMARILLNKKADMEAKDMYGLTPCHLAVDGNQGEILKFALATGANAEASDACGWTLLMRAVVMNADFEILQLLVNHGVDLLCRDKENMTCVDLARLYGNKKAEEYLAELYDELMAKQTVRQSSNQSISLAVSPSDGKTMQQKDRKLCKQPSRRQLKQAASQASIKTGQEDNLVTDIKNAE